MSGLIGKKLGMTQVYRDEKVVPVTVVEVGPCKIIGLRTSAKNGYSALQLGFGFKSKKNVTKPVMGQFKKAGCDEANAIIKEIRLKEDSQMSEGDILDVSIFKQGNFVDITGTTKGHGFQGVVKRYNFGGGRASHGGDWTRKPGSIGMCEFPARVIKGKKMPGHMGNVRKTVQGLEIIEVRPEENIMLIKGAVPGSPESIVTLINAKKKALAEG